MEYIDHRDRLRAAAVEHPQGDKSGNEICVRVTQAGQPMDLHRFWDGVITSSPNLTRLRNEATALRNRQEFQRSQLTELASTDFESWAKESLKIVTKIAYRNGAQIGIQKEAVDRLDDAPAKAQKKAATA